MGIGWGAAAQKSEGIRSCSDLMPGACGDQDGISRSHRFHLSVNFHRPGAFFDEVKFFRYPVIMSLGEPSRGKAGFRETLILDRGIGSVEKGTNRGTVFGGEGGLGSQAADCHESEGIAGGNVA